MAAAGVLSLTSGPTASATVVFTSATRMISASASNQTGTPAGDFASDTFTGLGGYDHAVQAQIQSFNAPPGTLQEATAEQHSFISADTVTFTGRVFGVDRVSTVGLGDSRGHSELTLTFTTDASTPWTCAFSNLNNPFNGNITSAALLLRDSSNVIIQTIDGFSGPPTRTGVLAPGTYSITIGVTAGYGGPGTGSHGTDYNWTFGVTAPAPASGSLLGGVGVLAMRRRRR